MIEDDQVNCLSGAGELSGRPKVGVAWPTIAAWMIMGQNDSGAAEPGGVGNDLAHGQVDGSGFAQIMFDMDTKRRAVHVGDQQLLARLVRALEAGRKEAKRSFMAIEESRCFGTLISHAGLCMDPAVPGLCEQSPMRID